MTEHIKKLIETKNVSLDDFISVIDEVPLWSAPFGLDLLEKIPFKKEMQVLDIGFGTGFPMLEIAQRLGARSKISGIDPWAEAVERVKLKIKMYDIKNVALFTGNAENMPFEQGMMDLIVSNNGLNNVLDIHLVLTECFRVMKPGAHMVFTVNLPGTMVEFYSIFEAVLLSEGLHGSIKKMHAHIAAKRKGTDEWIDLLSSFDLQVNHQEEKSFRLRYADGTAMLGHHFIRLAFIENWKEIIPGDKINLVFQETEKRLNEMSGIKNGLELTIPYVCIVCSKPFSQQPPDQKVFSRGS